MSAAPASQPAAVSVRLIGNRDACARLLMTLIENPDFAVVRGPYTCDSDPGVRWYVTVRPAADPTQTQRGAAHSHQAIRRPAAPSRRHLPS